jgi:hypothetical protein
MYEYTESYIHLDVDGDGIAELRQICTLGTGHYVTNGDGLGRAGRRASRSRSSSPTPSRTRCTAAPGPIARWISSS